MKSLVIKSNNLQSCPLKTTCPSFLFAIKGLSTICVKDVFPIVQTVWDSDKTRAFANSLLDDIPDQEKTQTGQEIDLLLSSMSLIRLDIKETGNTLAPRFNVYADCNNFSNDNVWTRLRAFLHEATYTSPMKAEPATTKLIPFVCTCCHGVDHPRGLCPFPSLVGWNGPQRDVDTDPPQRRNRGALNNPPYSNRRPQRQRYTEHN